MVGGNNLYGPESCFVSPELLGPPPEADLTICSCLLLLLLLTPAVLVAAALVPMLTILLVLVLTASLLGEVVMPSCGRGMPPPSRDFLLSDLAINDGDF